MKTCDFDFDLPSELIAQHPESSRDKSRLLVLSRQGSSFAHHFFSDLLQLLKPGDRLVLNNARVIPARVYCTKESGAKIELLFTQPTENGAWEALAKGRKRLARGTILILEKNTMVKIVVQTLLENGGVVVSLHSGTATANTIEEMLFSFGEIPLPPYINRAATSNDTARYQTVYAKSGYAIAAPTAGLHFTNELLCELLAKGINHSFVTLNVGIGTFRPVSVDDPTQHPIHSETFTLPPNAAKEINETRLNGGRIIAVGTTSVRVLESCAQSNGTVSPLSGSTQILILPGYKFKVVDALITNFHLPKSSLIMLCCALAGREFVLASYKEAIDKKYRFFSYGDAMLIL